MSTEKTNEKKQRFPVSGVAGRIKALYRAPQPKSPTPPTAGAVHTRIMIGAAAVPSVLALPWTATAVAGVVSAPWPVAIALGVLADVILIGTVALAWLSPAVRSQASLAGWAAAAMASAVIALHTGLGGQMLFAALPVLSKWLWHLVIAQRAAAERAEAEAAARRAEEERVEAERVRRTEEEAAAAKRAEEEADDTTLTVEQRRRIAQVRREAAFARAMADAQAEQEEATIWASNRVAMARDAATAERLRTRYELAAQVGGQLPLPVLAQIMPGVAEVTGLPGATATQIEAGGSKKTPAPRDRVAATARRGIADLEDWLDTGDDDDDGEGGGRGPEGWNPPGSPPGSLADLGGRPGTAPVGGGTPGTPADQGGSEGAVNRERVLAAINAHGPSVSNRALERELGLSRTTIRTHREALKAQGHQVYS